jgi:Bifunctional DNA primase/polymerase, N-terminal
MTSISEGIKPSHILSLHKIGFKLVPILEDAFTPSIAWTKVYESGWTEDELSKLQFSNIATCFGKSHLEDKEGKALYLNCLDIDSEEVFTRLAIVTDEKGKSRFLIGELCEQTYVTKTRKKHGRHIYWFSHNLNPAIHLRDCRLAHEFEIKTDNSSGLASLPPSVHRADRGFYYQNIGQNHIVIHDSLYGTIISMLDDCLTKKK